MKNLFTKITGMVNTERIRIQNNKLNTYYTLIGLMCVFIMSISFISLFNIIEANAIENNKNDNDTNPVQTTSSAVIDEEYIIYTTTKKCTTSTTNVTSTSTSVTDTTTTETVTTVETTTTITTETTTQPPVTEPPIIVTEPEPEYMLYKPKTHYVHRSTCRWNRDETRRIESEADIGDSARICTECNPDITIENVYQEPIIEQQPQQNIITNGDGTLLGTYQATWYTAVDMGYSAPPKGASGRVLETAYSVASNSIPQGSIIRIEGGGIDGIYRVDDRGGMANNVIDMYYYNRSSIPASFKRAGRININVYLIE